MKTMKTLTLGFAAMALAGASLGQQSTAAFGAMPSVRENPGLLGQNYADFHFGVADFRRSSADAYQLGVTGITPVAPGLDFGIGYNYYWESHRTDLLPGTNLVNPAGRTDYDGRSHLLSARTRVYPYWRGGMKPFLQGTIGYQWLSGDLQRLRTDNHWLWGATAGLEIPIGAIALTPHVAYTDELGKTTVALGAWHYGAEVHYWFTERTGGYLDATYHEPRAGGRPEFWTYTAGLRIRY